VAGFACVAATFSAGDSEFAVPRSSAARLFSPDISDRTHARMAPNLWRLENLFSFVFNQLRKILIRACGD
jgi:hypothetical protein